MKLYMDKLIALAENKPDKPALVDSNGQRCITYGQLMRLAYKYAAYYISKGLKRGDIIMVAGEWKSEYIAAELGAFIAGCGVAPVNAHYPPERLAIIKEDSKSPLTMTEDLICKVADEDVCGPVPSQPLLQSDDVAFLIYTSGSTGRPKGVYCDYSTFTARCTPGTDVCEDDIVLNTAPFFFVAVLANMFGCLALGATVHIASMALVRDIRAIENYIYDHRVTITFLSPQMLRLFNNKSDALRILATGSEKVTGFQTGNYTVMNAYGMSESLGPVIKYETKDGFHDDFPIGKPCVGFEAYLLDDELKPVPDGEEGEIVVSGALASGYYNRPEETAKAFVENPFAKDEQHRRMLRTGDLGRRDKDGNIVYVNRKDWMVKINGQRVEPGEIEQQLRSIPGVGNAVVKAFTGKSGQSYLCAYYTASEGAEPSEEEIRSFLSARLAAYMIPSFFTKLDRLPLNQNGKLDRTALKEPDISSFHKAYEQPADENEEKLCAAFEKVLQCGRVGVNDDFFALGGNSINVLMIVSESGIDGLLPVNVFSGRTPRKIAKKISVAGADLYAECAEDSESYPLTDSQMGVYLECVANPKSTMYNIPLIYRSARAGRMDIGKLKAAVEKALGNHPSLNAELVTAGGLPAFRRGSEAIAVRAAEMDESRVSAYIAGFIRPFDLGNEPLCRAEIVYNKDNIYLLFDMHHMVFDGTSSTVLINDVIRCYNGCEPEPETITMFRQSVYEKKLVATDKYRQAEAFFDEKLSGLDNDSNLIPDVIVKKEQVKGGATLNRVVLENVSEEAVSGFLRGNGLTENTLFMGAFAYALAKFTNQNDVLFCTADNGRHDVRLSNTVGMLVRTLPLHMTVDEKRSPTEFLCAAQEYFMDTMANDACSFGALANKYGVNSDIMFVYQSDMISPFELDGAVFQPQTRNVDPQANLTIMVFKRAGRYIMNVEYRTELYTEALIDSFVQAMDAMLTGFFSKNSLKDIDLISPAARNRLALFNKTETDDDTEKTVIAQFREQAAKTPDNVAVVYKDETLTYRELDEVSERVGEYAAGLGIGPEDVIAILVERGPNMPVCALGALKSGAGYQPLDASYPPERLQFMIKDSGAKLLIVDESLRDLLPDYTGNVLLTKDIATLKPTGAKLSEARPENLFIMLYTSGTTGVPKGCMLENRNISSFIAWYKKYNGFTAESVVAQYASFGFDACMMDLYATLTCGARLVIVGDDIRLDMAELDRYFEKEQVTIAFMTTQVGRLMAETTKCTSLRQLIVGGEKLVPIVPPKGFVFSNGYGPTETTILVTACPVVEEYSDVPIGKALDNVKLYIIDAFGRLLPPCMPGELLIAGPHVSRGYLNRPEQTEKVFTANPFASEKGYERVYHTGDIVRYLPDGSVQFIGRRDAQVKIRGFRVELAEVECVVREYPGVKDATVAAFDNPSGGKYIAAYVVSDSKIDVDSLNNFILERKPPYIVPAVTMQIDSIPLNQNQKVNRRALPVPQFVAEETVAPETETQRKIFDFAAKVIGNDGFGVTTDLFRAGLNSIGAIKLNSLLADEFHIAIRNSDLKAYNTVRRLEQFIGSAAAEETFAPQADYPLTQTQYGVFVECVAHPGSTIYNIPVLMKLNPSIDIDRLKAAAIKAVDAHPYVKTRLAMNSDGDIRAHRRDGVHLRVADVSVADFDAYKKRPLEPFKLLGGPLIRVKLIRAQGDCYFFIEMHHIIGDGTSIEILLNDISRAYAGETLEREKFSGFENALSEERARGGDGYAKAMAYYGALFDGCDAECLPIRDIKEKLPDASERLIASGNAVSAETVMRFCDAHRVTPNAFFTAAFGILVGKFCRKDEAVFTAIYNGRNDSRLKNTVSMLVKTYPVLCKVGDGDMNVVSYVSSIQKELMDNMANDIYSFAEISRAFGIKADLMFAYQGDEFIFDTLCGEKCEMVNLAPDQAKAPINVNVFINDGKVKYVCEYASNLYTGGFIESFIAAYDQVVSELLLKQKLREISLLTEKSRAQIEDYNANDAPVNPLLPSQLFEQQAALHPDKTAVTAAGRSLTFKELNELANRVAHALISNGAAPETIVGLMLGRTVDAYAAREGILKSGGAFMAIDPDYPDERVSYIISDSGAKLFITTEELYERRKALFDGLPAKVLTLGELYRCEDVSNPAPNAKPENIAYCIYTSGSTGRPKGVMIERRNLMNMLNDSPRNILARDYIDNTTVFLGLAALTFDVSIIEEMMPLYHGQSVAMATEDEIHNPIALAEMMLKTGVDMMKCTPSYMTTIMDEPKVQEALRRLKAIVIGAEAFPRGLYEKMRAAGISGKIFNSYGPTETTVTVAIDELDGRNITIGRACNNVKILMLDKFDNILPPRAPGELTIVGKSVGRGYIGLDEITKEKFISFGGERAYRSGDIAYWNASGKIEFCGRSDNQVKLRGLRVEIDEIENAINSYPAIKRSVVLVKENSSGQYLCAYYCATGPVEQAELTAFISKKLANYMVPSVFVPLAEMPMNKNGKIDKRALPEPALVSAGASVNAPRTELEAKLCDIFSHAIGIESIGVDDDFFKMGGTSLSASKVAMRCMMEKLPVVYANIFDYSTPEKLAAFIEAQRGTKTVSQPVHTEAAPDKPAASDSPYAKAESVLAHNAPEYVRGVHPEPIGNVLLTGATGFLGIHVLRELLRSDCPKIYCLVRKGKLGSSVAHLKMLLMYYFDDTFDELFEGRISVVPGDITDATLKDKLKDCAFDTVINCAACVKHFVQDDLLERVNVGGVENLIGICKSMGKRLVQVSTVSVAGNGVIGQMPIDKAIHENELYFGQSLDNKYVASKFRAETKVLEAVADGMRGKIIRVGNLMSRFSDGEFQVNFFTNGFMNRMKAYATIGEFPLDALDAIAEFSPIDKTAQAIVLLAGTPDEYTVFHAYNCHSVHVANVLDALKRCGFPVEPVENEEFQRAFAAKLADEKVNMKVSVLVSYVNNDSALFPISSANAFTTKALYRLGFSWPLIDGAYMEKAITALMSLGFFD